MTNIIEQLITNYNTFERKPNKKGWLPILCKVCNDHGKKGLRGAFLFTPETASYHCFNCNISATYSSTQEYELSGNLVKVLTSFGVSQDQINEINFNIRKNNPNSPQKYKKKEIVLSNVKEIVMPHCCLPLKEAPPIMKECAELYLKEMRGIDPYSYPFYIGVEQPNDLISKRWDKRLIIPCYKDQTLVYYEGRDLTDKKEKKYISADVSKSNILYGFDKLFNDKDKPLFVCEGFFDALLIDGVAIFGNKLYPEIIQHLSLSPRTKVVIPDRQGDGYKLAEHAVNLGWKISIPDVSRDCKDINEAILKYGKLYVVKSIMDNICDGFEASLKINMFLKGKGR